jgi:hypothetical protein
MDLVEKHPGRSRTGEERVALVVRKATENWCTRIQGAMDNVGHRLGRAVRLLWHREQPVVRCPRLAGLLNYYERAAA